MNTANLQIEGLLSVLACMIETLRRKELLTAEDVEALLNDAESMLVRPTGETLSPANRDAILFPIRFLRAMKDNAEDSDRPLFRDLTVRSKAEPGGFSSEA